MEYGRAGGGIEALAMAKLIYITEDDDNIRELLRCTLESYGYRVQCFDGAAGMFDAIRGELPDLILLDIMMPGMDGMEALRTLKNDQRTGPVPVIMLTAKSGEVDKVTGLDLGADDYITKPFGLLELTARVRAALRRNPSGGGKGENILTAADITLNVDSHEVFRDGTPLELTLKEFELLKLLILNSNRVVPRENLLGEIWGYDYMGETRTLDMHIKTLRAKLGDDADNPRYIKTVRSVGYKFIAKP